MNRKLVLLTLSCFMVGAYAADQQVYKWTDASGVTHFSDAPPPKDAKGVQLMRVTSNDRPRAADSQSNSETGGAEPGSSANGASESATANSGNANAKACATARNNLEILNSKMPVSVTGPDGKAVPLDDKARQAQIAVANANIELYCKP